MAKRIYITREFGDVMLRSQARTIVVDGDACPVKKEIVAVARSFGIPVLMVSSFDHVLQAEEGVTVVQVDRGADSADLYIANHVSAGDVVITGTTALRHLRSANVARYSLTGDRNMTIPTWILCWRAGMPVQWNAGGGTIPRVQKRSPQRKK